MKEVSLTGFPVESDAPPSFLHQFYGLPRIVPPWYEEAVHRLNHPKRRPKRLRDKRKRNKK